MPLNCTLKNGKGWYLCYVYFCCCSVTQLCLTLCDSMDCRVPASLSFTISWSLLRLMSTESVMPSNLFILSPSSYPALNLSQHQGLLMSHGGQSIGASASESIFLVNMFILPPASAGDIRDMGLIPGSGRSPGGGHGNPLQYSCWRIPWTEEPGGLQYIESQWIGHDWSDLACTTIKMHADVT